MSMESQSSWRVETTTSSEFAVPTVPGQRSPSLYPTVEDEFVYEHKRPTSLKACGETQSKKCLGTRAEFAAKLLRDLEGLPPMDFESEDDFGGIWNEESIQLELFKELSDVGLRYTPPTTPNSDEFENQHQLSEFSDPTVLFGDSSIQSSEFPELYNELSAEFQNILESIPVTTADESKVVESVRICGIPILQLEQDVVTTTEDVDVSGMDDDESDPDYSDQSQSSNNGMEATSGDEDDLGLECAFTEHELAECGISGDDKSLLIPIEENILDLSCKTEFDLELESDSDSDTSDEDDESTIIDVESTVSDEAMLDLLSGKRFTQSEAFTRKTREERPSTSAVKEDKPKSLRRIREPSTSSGRTRVNSKTKKNKKGSKNNDKVKLQNRTAAAKYRQKKKQEALKVKAAEEIIEKENDALQNDYDDLKRQITLVKQLIRDVFKSKKIQTQQRRTTVLKTNVRK